MSNVFETPVQPRFRDLNAGQHVDSVECVRLLDEARLYFFRWAALPINEAGALGLFAHLPDGVAEVIASHHINYRQEIFYTGNAPFRVQVWISRIGRTSFEVSSQLLVAEAAEPALIGASTTVMQDHASGQPWVLDDTFRAALAHYAGDRLPIR